MREPGCESRFSNFRCYFYCVVSGSQSNTHPAQLRLNRKMNYKQYISNGNVPAGENLELPTNMYSVGSKTTKRFLLDVLGTADDAEF